MAQVLTSDEAESEVSRIQNYLLWSQMVKIGFRGLVARKIDLNRCGSLTGNENARFWSQEI